MVGVVLKILSGAIQGLEVRLSTSRFDDGIYRSRNQKGCESRGQSFPITQDYRCSAPVWAHLLHVCPCNWPAITPEWQKYPHALSFRLLSVPVCEQVSQLGFRAQLELLESVKLRQFFECVTRNQHAALIP